MVQMQLPSLNVRLLPLNESIEIFFLMILIILVTGATSADIQKIRDAIKKANSLQEVERLTRMLQSGQISAEFLNGEEPMITN